MRRFLIAFSVISIGTIFVPLVAYADPIIPFFGPIVPNNNCALGFGWGGVIIVVNNLIRLLLTLAIVFVVPIMIAWAGFLLVANPFNPGAKEKAKGMLLNLVVGITVALASWLIVDALMAVVYHPTGNLPQRWYEIITSGGQGVCLSNQGTELPPVSQPGGISTVPPASGGRGTTLCSQSNAACSTTNLQNYGLSSPQASAMSCIAMTESAGGSNVDNGNPGSLGAGCNSSNHCGIYQLSQDLMSTYGPQGCTQDMIISNGGNCNTRTAVAVLQARGYGDWTGGGLRPWNSASRTCVSTYDPTTTHPGFTYLYKMLVAYLQRL